MSAPRPPPPRVPRRRLTDRLAGVLLLGAILAVAISASPALLRAAGLGSTRLDASPHDAGRLQLPQPPAGGPAHPIFAPGALDEDDEDRGEPLVTGLERDYPDGMWPGRRTAEESARNREIFGEPDRAAGRAGTRRGVTRSMITLLEAPGGEGSVLAMVRANEPVRILKEAGEWTLVAYVGSHGTVKGWVKKSEIAVR